MLASLCAAMAVIPSVSRNRGHDGRSVPSETCLPALSWQHRLRDCGTLVLKGRWAVGGKGRCRRTAAERQAGGVHAGRLEAGRSRQWQAPARKVSCSDER